MLGPPHWAPKEITITPNVIADTTVTVGTVGDGTQQRDRSQVDGGLGIAWHHHRTLLARLVPPSRTSPANADFLTPCNEITTINFIQ